MTSGGARARSGPPPDRGAIRRNRPGDRAGWIHLPASGRDGDPPPWPFARPTAFERERWSIEWRRPQAIMWEKLGLEVQVALYVRTMRKASQPRSAAVHTTELVKQMNNLGLTVPGLAANRWVIDDAPVQAPPRRRESSSAKDRLAVITGGADAHAS
jgi:hypothetical protein